MLDTRSDPAHGALVALLPAYGLSSQSALTRLTVSENITYRADDPVYGSALILRLHRPGYQSQTSIRSELAWIDALHGEGLVETAKPLLRADGAALSEIEVAGQRQCVSAFSLLPGREPTVGAHLEPMFEKLGGLTARLHDHARRWRRPGFFERPSWTFETMFGARPVWGDWRAAQLSDDERALLEDLQRELGARLAAYGRSPERFGLIHGDLRLANLLDDGGRLAVIDFDDCGFGWFAYDFAAAISFHEEDPSIPTLRRAWLAGYRQVGQFGAEDEAMLPTFVMTRRLLLTAWLASRAGNDTEAAHGAGFAQGTVRLARLYLATGSTDL